MTIITMAHPYHISSVSGPRRPQHCPGALLSLAADGPRAPPGEPDVEAKQNLDGQTLGHIAHTKAKKSGQRESQNPA